MESGIYIVATPIGNLSDISFRAIEVLKAVEVIAAEDTRHTRKLLEYYDISTRMISLHEHNEYEKASVLIERVQAGGAVALVSDAGTPLISDPGHVLVKLAHEAGVKLSPIPGASAVIAGLSVSGVACGKFIFEGFLPAKEKAKKEVLEQYLYESKAVVFYESPHRVLSTMAVMTEMFGGREIAVAREITKHFETIKKGEVSEVFDWMKADENQQKGEFVLILSGETSQIQSVSEQEQRKLLKRLLRDLPPKKAASVLADIFGGAKKGFYEWAIEMRSTDS